MDDFKPQQPDQPVQSGDTNDETQQTYTDNPATYETIAVEEPIQSDETVTPAPVVMGKKKSPVKKWFLGFFVVLLIMALGGLSYWQWSEAQNARSEAATLRTSLEAAQKQNQADAANTDNAVDDTVSASDKEDFVAFLRQYDAIQGSAVNFTESDKLAIEKGIKDYYKLNTLPAGWAILAVYKDAKASETTGKPLNALIYWPAGTKPAGFFEMNQAENGSWTYNDLR